MEPTRDDKWPQVLDEVTGALEPLTATLHAEDDFEALLHRVCEQVTNAVPGVNEATTTLLEDGKPATIASTSEVVVDLDHSQYSRGAGPCLEAVRTGELVRVSIGEVAERWPEFAGDAGAAGFGSFLSAPLTIDDGARWRSQLLQRPPGRVRRAGREAARPLHQCRTAALRAYCRYQQARDLTAQLRIALESRAVIDQAKGILMAIRQISADEAFTLLVEQSQRENVELRELAARFVAHATGT